MLSFHLHKRNEEQSLVHDLGKNPVLLEHWDGCNEFLIRSPLHHRSRGRRGSWALSGIKRVKILVSPLPTVPCFEAFPGCGGICFEVCGINSQLEWEGEEGEGRIGHAKWKWFINENIVLFVEGRVNFARTPLRLC